MNIITICIPTADLAIPVFESCDARVAEATLSAILKEHQDVLEKASIVVVSSTGLSLAISELFKASFGTLPDVFLVDCNEAIKNEIIARSNNLLSQCDTAFSQHSESFDAAMFAFGKKVSDAIKGLYTRDMVKPQDTVVVCMESFLLAAFNNVAYASEKIIDGTEEEKNTDPEDTVFL